MIADESLYGILLQDTAAPYVTEEKILGFAELRDGWHYGEGVPPEESVLDNAISFSREAVRLAFFETDAFPGINGEVMFTIYYHDHYLEFTVEPDSSSVTFYREKGGEEVCYQEGLSFQEAKARIGEFSKETWKEYESSTAGITISDYAGSPALHLKTQETIPGYLLSIESVSNLGKLSVGTFEYSIKRLQAPPLFSGASQQGFYLPVTG